MLVVWSWLLTCTDASALAAAGENIELSSFGQKEREDVLKMQDGLRNLGGLLKLDHIDITRFITRPQSGFVNFQRIAAQFAVGGAITMTVGVSLDYIIHYHNNGNGYSIGGHGNQHTTATTATESISTAEPKSWLLNTVPGTSREAFEDFVSKLPDRGSGRRIVYPHMNHQYYVAKLTLEEANAVSKLTIVDQLGSNERIRFDPWCEELPWRAQWRNRLERRANHCVINRAISCRSHRLTNSIWPQAHTLCLVQANR